MINDLKDVMAYLINHYPDTMKDELSNARLTKMVYLSDWHQAIKYGRQITKIEWYFDNYGPFVHDIEQTAATCSDIFAINFSQNMYGAPKRIYSLKNTTFQPQLDDKAKESLDHIIEVTQKIYWADFIKLVYSTHPVMSSERYSPLNLVEKAEEYKEMKAAREKESRV